MQDAIQFKGKKLAGAYEIHKFVRDAKDTLMRIKDKEGSIQKDDLGKSIQGVLALQRKMETFEREVAALGTKVWLFEALTWTRLLILLSIVVCNRL